MQYRLKVWCLVGLLCTGCQSVVVPSATFFSRSHDALLSEQLRNEFSQRPEFAAQHVYVTVDKGTVYLSGYVETIRQRDDAETVAQRLDGVKHVENNLIVRKTI